MMNQTPNPMINERLYNKLLALTGEVKVIREDEEAEYTRAKIKPGEGSAGGIVPKLELSYGGEEYNCCCPFCDDKHFHLYINHLYGTEAPVNSTSLAYCFHGCLSDPDNRDRLRQMLMGFTTRLDKLPKPVKIVKREKALQAVEPLDNVISISELPDNHDAIKYLVDDRGYDLKELIDLNVGYCPRSSRYNMITNRIVIPITMNGIYVGWQARYIGAAPKSVPKYYTAPGMRKSSILYNFDVAKQQKYVVITEGVMDAWRVGKPGVCLFGKYISKAQVALLAENLRQKPIIVMLDSDASVDADAVSSKIQKEGLRVHNLCIVNYKDPGEMTRDLIERSVEAELSGY